MPGIITSSSTMSHSARSQNASPAAPQCAVVTSKYSADSRASSNFTFAGTSSTTNTRALITYFPNSRSSEKTPDRLHKLANRDRLREVGLAAALADALLVTLHRERRDGDHGDRPALRIVLEPLRHFEARHFGQLNIHQHQVGPVLASEVERLDPIAGSNGRIAMGFQQVVEELHVQFVVLDDQHRLGH